MNPKINLLQDNIPLYDNVANYKDHVGRLSSHLEVFPSPIILWDFEVLGDEVNQKGSLHTEIPMSPIGGYQFEIPHPFPTTDSHNFLVPRECLSGQAFQANFGDPGNKGHAFGFFLPNTRFQAINLLGQQSIKKSFRKENNDELRAESGGKLLEARLDETWHVTLRTSEEALSWLKVRESNIGSRITAIGYLHSSMGDSVKFIDYPTLTLTEAQSYIEILSKLLSFLNGGYTSAIFIESIYHHSPGEEISDASAIIQTYRTTPLELLGASWCTYDSDLPAYISCFPILRQMLSSYPWNESFTLILSWYFQAIQPEVRNGGKMWQVIANALGTALERLGYTILVLEETNPELRERMEILFSTNQSKIRKIWNLQNINSSTKRLQLLLERIGISLERGFWDVNDVKSFIDLRNEATHPKPGNNLSRDKWMILDQATQ